MKITMVKGNERVEVKDFLVSLYERNGYEVVNETVEAEVKAETPKKTTRRRTTKKQ